MKFKIGEKLICVYPKQNYSCPNPLVKGQIYTVSHIYVCSCSSVQICLEEAAYEINMICGCGRFEKRRQSYYAWRFRKLNNWELYCKLFDNNNETGKREDIQKKVPVENN